VTAAQTRHQLNVRAVLYLTAASVVLALGLFLLWEFQETRVLASGLEQAKGFRKKGEEEKTREAQERNYALALRHLNQYLEARPDNPEALEIEAQLLMDRGDRGAVAAYEHLLRVDPNPGGARAQNARRKLASLYILLSNMDRRKIAGLMPEEVSKHLRFHAAELLADQLIAYNAKGNPPIDDPESHQLRAMALECQLNSDRPDRTTREVEVVVEGKKQTRTMNLAAEAIAEYRKALALKPEDLKAALGLASLYQSLKDPDAARKVLDDLLKTTKDLLGVRIVRSEFFRSSGDLPAAIDEIDQAAQLAPADLGIILKGTGLRLTSGRIDQARLWLDRIPEQSRHDPGVYVLQGMIEQSERNFEASIKTWIKGLGLAHNSDIELTRLLSLTLLRLGRSTEAANYVSQYHQLVGDEDPILRLLEGFQDQLAGRYSRAIERLILVRPQLEPRFQPLACLILGHSQVGQGDFLEAARTYRLGLQLDTGAMGLELQQSLVRLLLLTQPEAAAQEIAQGLVAHPDQPELLVTLAELKLREQRARAPEERSWAELDDILKRAEAALTQATAATPLHTKLSGLRAERLALESDSSLDQAVSFLTKEVQNAPKSAELATRLSELLLRQGRTDQALEVIYKVSDPKAAGDRGLLRIQQAKILAALGQGRQARSVLLQDVKDLSTSEQDDVWGVLADLCRTQGDPETSRAAFTTWSRQLPDDLRPKLALLELEIATNDADAIRARLESLRPRDPRDELLWQLAQARERLWERSRIVATGGTGATGVLNARKRRALLKEAETLVEKALREIRNDPTALLLKGQILEEEGAGEGDQQRRLAPAEARAAEEAYRQAVARGNLEALRRLIDLWVRLDKKDELERFRQSDTSKLVDIDQLEANAFLQHGNKAEAARVVERSLNEKPGIQAWQLQVLDVLGEKERVESALRTLAERSGPLGLERWLELVRYQTIRGQAQAAEQTIAELKRRVTSEQPELLEAQCRRATGNWAEADRAFSQAMGRYPNVIDVQMKGAQYFQERGQRDRAEECLRRVLAQNPNNRVARQQLARMFVTQTERPFAWKEALELLGPEQPATDTPEDRLIRAVVLAQSGQEARLKQARELLEALVADLSIMDRVGTAARRTLTRLLLASGRPEQASRVIERTANLWNDADTIALYAETLLQIHKFSTLEEQLKRLETIDQGRPLEAKLRVQMILKQEPPEKVAEVLEKTYLAREKAPGAELFGREAFVRLTQMRPEPLEVAERLGRRLAGHNAVLSWMPAHVLVNRGDRPGAIALCQTAAKSPGDLTDLREVCRIALEVAVSSRNDPALLERADSILVAVLAQAPEVDELMVWKAMLVHLEGRFEEEVRCYRSVLARKPQDTLVLNNIAWALSEGVHQPSEALGMIDTVVRLAGRNPNNIDTRGVILTRLGRHDEAIEELNWVVQAEPTGVHLYHLVHAYHAAGKENEFRASLEQMRKVGVTITDLDTTERAEYQALIGQ
jgi:predicted Zn-dependent protease